MVELSGKPEVTVGFESAYDSLNGIALEITETVPRIKGTYICIDIPVAAYKEPQCFGHLIRRVTAVEYFSI